MQGWMIALIVIAGVVVLITAAFIAWSLVSVHIILGRRKPIGAKTSAKKNYTAEAYGVRTLWFDVVKSDMQELAITAYDGVSLGATLIKQPESNGRVAICCHGYGATRRSMQPQAKLFYDRGFDVILPSMRGHAGAGGKVGMAWIDRFDLLRWIDKAVALFGKDVSIALCGTSMGGATVIAASGMKPPSQVKCVIDDCGFSSQVDEYTACLKGVHLPPSWLLMPFKLGVKLVHGYSIADADITKLAANMSIPALFIHGSADAFVPCALGQKLYDACSSADKKFITVDGAQHALAYVTDTEKYVGEFTAFVDKHIPGSKLVNDTTQALEELEAQKEAEREEYARKATEDAAPVESETPKLDNEEKAEQAEQSVATEEGNADAADGIVSAAPVEKAQPEISEQAAGPETK